MEAEAVRCCCGQKTISEPIGINDYVHEPWNVPDNFCGSRDKHTIRDLGNLLREAEELMGTAVFFLRNRNDGSQGAVAAVHNLQEFLERRSR